MRERTRNVPEYRVWIAMLGRCSNPNYTNWINYGGRGIQVRFDSFWEFYEEVGPRPNRHHSIDRINNDAHYEPGNVRWATAKEQANNQRQLHACSYVEGVKAWVNMVKTTDATKGKRYTPAQAFLNYEVFCQQNSFAKCKHPSTFGRILKRQCLLIPISKSHGQNFYLFCLTNASA